MGESSPSTTVQSQVIAAVDRYEAAQSNGTRQDILDTLTPDSPQWQSYEGADEDFNLKSRGTQRPAVAARRAVRSRGSWLPRGGDLADGAGIQRHTGGEAAGSIDMEGLIGDGDCGGPKSHALLHGQR
ncbi:MAG: hypothetical protein DI630_32050 [Gordonia sp. (in: high G+C Gram-positive bacteria)]|nr:MAG: hypothetical protein DI630_32050 [Gordonia sp. (in: high G+C Gram-positive bacteria)]